jgi:hypothetical protein
VDESWAPDPAVCTDAIPLTTGAGPPVPIPQFGVLFVPLLATGEVLATRLDAVEILMKFNTQKSITKVIDT